MKKLLILVAGAIALATAAVKAYDVDVYRNSLATVDGDVGRNGDTILNSIDIGIGWAYAQAWRE
jgi:hypothetical protein